MGCPRYIPNTLLPSYGAAHGFVAVHVSLLWATCGSQSLLMGSSLGYWLVRGAPSFPKCWVCLQAILQSCHDLQHGFRADATGPVREWGKDGNTDIHAEKPGLVGHHILVEQQPGQSRVFTLHIWTEETNFMLFKCCVLIYHSIALHVEKLYILVGTHSRHKSSTCLTLLCSNHLPFPSSSIHLPSFSFFP